MLRAAKHLDAHPDRPFAALRVTRKGHPIQLRAIYALMPSRPRPMESWTCVLGRCLLGDREGRPYIFGEFEIGDIDAVLPDEALTSREREVLELLSQGLPNKLIARRLQISEHTVKFHVSSIYAKLGATSRTDAVSRGVRRGLITL
jgi:DNA-binding CsgD family transcriptional regulator